MPKIENADYFTACDPFGIFVFPLANHGAGLLAKYLTLVCTPSSHLYVAQFFLARELR